MDVHFGPTFGSATMLRRGAHPGCGLGLGRLGGQRGAWLIFGSLGIGPPEAPQMVVSQKKGTQPPLPKEKTKEQFIYFSVGFPLCQRKSSTCPNGNNDSFSTRALEKFHFLSVSLNHPHVGTLLLLPTILPEMTKKHTSPFCG